MFMYYFILFFILRLSTAQGDCSPTRCFHHGPKIRFPFRLKNHQYPPHCGYPGFDLSCSPNTNATLLNLPYSVQVIVTKIDYKSQLIHIKDPNSCFPQQLQNLSLSITPFQFVGYPNNFSLFSCPPSTDPDFSYQMITCLGGHGREVRVSWADDSIGNSPFKFISCRKMFNVPSVPYEVFDQTPHLQLKWLQPVCGECESEGKFCRLKRNSTSDEIECFGDLNPLIKAQGDCSSKRCFHHGPKIRFPFRLKDHQPPHCGYPGFDLSCSPNTTATLLNLPYSVQVLVTNIDYKSQLIHIKDPNNCFPQQLQNLNLSTTPFQFAATVYNYSLFSCPPSTDPDFWYGMITCLGGHGRDVRVGGDDSIESAPLQLISCRKMFNVPSVPYEVFDQTPHLQLKWLQPVCGECEAKGKFCRLKRNSTSDEIECFGDLNPLKKGTPFSSFPFVSMLKSEKVKRKFAYPQ